MGINVNPYINLRGQAREALAVYQRALGGEVTATSFRDAGVPVPEAEADWIMHGQIQTDHGIVLMASDAPSHMELAGGSNISVSLSGDDEATLRGYWDVLVEGGTVTEPLVQAPWGDTFGSFTDRFGINWMINIAGAPS